MKNYWIWILIALVLVVIGYYYFANSDTEPTTPNETNGTTQVNEAGDTAVVTISSLDDAGISGTATLTEEAGGLTVTINTAVGNLAVPMPAHIHNGTCPGIGTIAYPLQDVEGGVSVTSIAGLTLADLENLLPLAINLHQSAEQMGNYVACGELDL